MAKSNQRIFFYQPTDKLDGGPVEAGWFVWYAEPLPAGPWSALELVAGPFPNRATAATFAATS